MYSSGSIWLISFLFGAFLTLSGFKVFEPWGQIVELWGFGYSPLQLVGHPHFFRYIISYPGFFLDSYFQNIGFSLYINLFFAANCLLWHKFVVGYASRAPSFIFWMLFIATHFFMNGRGVIAWTAWLMCIGLCLDLIRSSEHVGFAATRVILSCFMAAVSTGIFSVVVFALMYHIFRRIHNYGVHVRYGDLLGLLVLMFSTYFIVDYFLFALDKNIEYYGGGVGGMISMLQHGMGAFLLHVNLIGLFVALSGGSVVVYFLFKRFGFSISELNRLRLVCVFGGLFGFTVLTLIIPLLLCFEKRSSGDTYSFGRKYGFFN